MLRLNENGKKKLDKGANEADNTDDVNDMEDGHLLEAALDENFKTLLSCMNKVNILQGSMFVPIFQIFNKTKLTNLGNYCFIYICKKTHPLC